MVFCVHSVEESRAPFRPLLPPPSHTLSHTEQVVSQPTAMQKFESAAKLQLVKIPWFRVRSITLRKGGPFDSTVSCCVWLSVKGGHGNHSAKKRKKGKKEKEECWLDGSA